MFEIHHFKHFLLYLFLCFCFFYFSAGLRAVNWCSTPYQHFFQNSEDAKQIFVLKRTTSLRPSPSLSGEAAHLQDMEVGYTLIGHSERRSKYGETDEDGGTPGYLGWRCSAFVRVCGVFVAAFFVLRLEFQTVLYWNEEFADFPSIFFHVFSIRRC